ncbi:hypothetical protein EVAR_85344_1 [Eumeta japonica]|uniref:Uncharacterized protein n=1 Tax=Eumeta variegata TaxID=151549 RepID=A0A4C1WRZ4_EUMVA|nr:hypothetical protein EVAR_85344_1 [Eumeta japonica]
MENSRDTERYAASRPAALREQLACAPGQLFKIYLEIVGGPRDRDCARGPRRSLDHFEELFDSSRSRNRKIDIDVSSARARARGARVSRGAVVPARDLRYVMNAIGSDRHRNDLDLILDDDCTAFNQPDRPLGRRRGVRAPLCEPLVVAMDACVPAAEYDEARVMRCDGKPAKCVRTRARGRSAAGALCSPGPEFKRVLIRLSRPPERARGPPSCPSALVAAPAAISRKAATGLRSRKKFYVLNLNRRLVRQRFHPLNFKIAFDVDLDPDQRNKKEYLLFNVRMDAFSRIAASKLVLTNGMKCLSMGYIFLLDYGEARKCNDFHILCRYVTRDETSLAAARPAPAPAPAPQTGKNRNAKRCVLERVRPAAEQLSGDFNFGHD